jgi:hypothetical protein
VPRQTAAELVRLLPAAQLAGNTDGQAANLRAVAACRGVHVLAGAGGGDLAVVDRVDGRGDVAVVASVASVTTITTITTITLTIASVAPIAALASIPTLAPITALASVASLAPLLS